MMFGGTVNNRGKNKLSWTVKKKTKIVHSRAYDWLREVCTYSDDGVVGGDKKNLFVHISFSLFRYASIPKISVVVVNEVGGLCLNLVINFGLGVVNQRVNFIGTLER
jgi:hypothetical protein